MAVSLLRHGCLYATRRFTLTACSWRLYSSSKEGAGSTSSVDSEEKTNKQCDKISEAPISPDSCESVASPPNIQRPSGSSPTERAVDKFFKVVEKVKKHGDRKETFSNISEAAAIEMQQGIGQEDSRGEDEILPFATMLRRSKFISLGEFSGRLVEGTIFEVMGDDLYIDFGGKFHCVCPRPKRNPDHYHRGKKVLVTLQAMEMSSAFLGSDKHITLLEADATLIGMAPSHGHPSTIHGNLVAQLDFPSSSRLIVKVYKTSAGTKPWFLMLPPRVVGISFFTDSNSVPKGQVHLSSE